MGTPSKNVLSPCLVQCTTLDFFPMLFKVQQKKKYKEDTIISQISHEKTEAWGLNEFSKVLVLGHIRSVSGIQVRLKQMPTGSFYHTYFSHFTITQNKLETSLECLQSQFLSKPLPYEHASSLINSCRTQLPGFNNGNLIETSIWHPWLSTSKSTDTFR